MNRKAEIIKRALRDRKLIRQAATRATLPKIKNLLAQSVLDQQQDGNDMSRQDVRKILGVEIPQETKQRQQMNNMMSNRPQQMTPQSIAKQNNSKVDSNKAERQDAGTQGGYGQTPAGIIKQGAEYARPGEDVNPQVRHDPATPEIAIHPQQALNANPEDIQDDKQNMSNSIQNIDDRAQNSGRRKQQVEGKLADARSQTIKTSAEQNMARKQKEMQDMKESDWIKQSLQSLRQTNIYQEVGLQQEAGRPNTGIIEQTFMDSKNIPVQEDERNDKIVMPSARDQGIASFLDANADDTRSNSRSRQAQLSTQDRQAEQKHRQIKVQSVEKDTTKPRKGRQVITQEDKRKMVEQVNTLRQVGKSRLMQASKYKMFARFVVKNFSKLNQNRINKLYQALMVAKDPKKLRERYSKRQTILNENVNVSPQKKKIFESNKGKFNKLRQSQLNSKEANAASQSDPENDRLRQLAGLN